MITQDELKALLDYDSETGVFTWKVDRHAQKVKGRTAGTIEDKGYVLIRVFGRLYRGHRLAWLYSKGSFPSKSLDHINGVRSNNSLSNLREATTQENSLNTGKQVNNTSGFKGVKKSLKGTTWVAQAGLNGRKVYLGTFATPEEASLAYREFCSKNHGVFIHQSVATGLTN